MSRPGNLADSKSGPARFDTPQEITQHFEIELGLFQKGRMRAFLENHHFGTGDFAMVSRSGLGAGLVIAP